VEELVAAPLAGQTLAPTASELVIAEWKDSGESSAEQPIAPPHFHRSDDEGWYVRRAASFTRFGTPRMV